MKTVVQVGLVLAMAAGTAQADTLALVAADSPMFETNVQQAMMATGKFTSVDIIDTQSSTPTLASLSAYTDVLAWTAAAPAEPAALGNVLASYFDLGGKHLTIATYAFSQIASVAPFFLPNPLLGGTVASAPYAAFTNVGANGDVSGVISPVAAGDPIFTGLDLTTVFYFENQYFAHPALAAGATLIAADGTGSSAVALIGRSQKGIVNLNFYPAGTAGEELGANGAALYTLLANSFLPVSDPPADPPAPPVANPGGPYTFCTESKPWSLDGTKSSDPEAGLSDSGAPPDHIVSYAWDLGGTGTFTDASGAQPDVTAFFTKLGAGTYPVQLRVTSSTAASFPSSHLANLTGTASTSVVVKASCSCVADLAAADTGFGKIKLTWSNAGASRYNVYRSKTSGAGYTLLGSRHASATSYLDDSAVAGATYFYVVREATTAGTETCQSNEASVTAATDTTAPTTTTRILPDPNKKGWNHSNVAVMFHAEDNHGGSGVKQISISWSGADTGSRVAAGREAWILVGNEGTTTVTYFSTDRAGNSETPKTLTVMIDKTDPTVTATLSPAPDSNGISHSPVTVTFTGTDSLSGIASCTAPVILSPDGSHTAKGSCTDNAGNVSAPLVQKVTFAPGGPAIAGIPQQSCILSPENDKLHLVATLSVKPAQATSFSVTATSSDPAPTGQQDIVITGSGLQPRAVQLRATSLNGNGRTYTVTATAANSAGVNTVDTFTCTVPKSGSSAGPVLD